MNAGSKDVRAIFGDALEIESLEERAVFLAEPESQPLARSKPAAASPLPTDKRVASKTCTPSVSPVRPGCVIRRIAAERAGDAW